MAWPADDITTGTLVTAAMLNIVANPPACRVNRTTDQAITDASGTVVLFTAERFDTDTMHDTASNTGRITFTTAGVYHVAFSGLLQAAGDYLNIHSELRLNGTTNIARDSIGTVADSSQNIGVGVATLYKFAAADYVEVVFLQNNSAGASRNLLGSSGDYGAEFSAVRVARG